MTIALVQKAITLTGTKAELARRMGVTPQFITKMAASGVVPSGRCRQIEKITAGQVRAEDLRPDIFGPFAA